MRLLSVGLLAALSVTLSPSRAAAIGELITDVRVLDNVRTEEDTVRSIAGIAIGDVLEPNTLEQVRERLNSSGLFADVNVFWEPHKEGVRVSIAVKDKFPWVPLPTFSLSPGNVAFGLLFVHGNLFGRGKQLVAGARYSTRDSGATVVYRDPSLLGTWLYYQVQGKFQDQTVPEFDPRPDLVDRPLRETDIRSVGFEGLLGVAWLRRVKTQFAWHIEKFDVRRVRYPHEGGRDPYGSGTATIPEGSAGSDAVVGFARGSLIFDFRAREHAVVYGNALSLNLESASSTWLSDLDYWKAWAGYEHYVRFFRRHNLVLAGSVYTGENLPLWNENWLGGSSLRGYVHQQFRGDTIAKALFEYHFPLFSIGPLDFRALGFFESGAAWYMNLPPVAPAPDPMTGRPVYETRRDGRRFLPPDFLEEGFDIKRDVRNAVGGGLRFYLKSVAVPLIGIDYGYGLESKAWRFFLVIGA